jgi:hypothetical protein
MKSAALCESEAVEDNCARAFGLIQAAWATYNYTRSAEDQAAWLAVYEGSATRFEEAYSASVSYNDVKAVLYSTEAPQQTAAVDVIYDGTDTIAAYDGSELPPKQLSELTMIIRLEELQVEDVCVAITKGPSGDKPDFYFACGRFLSDKSEGTLCGRHKQLPYSL